MFLHRLEVENFKSYRGHTVIGPFTRFTSIIGHNGGGKSNTMDAIAFALAINTKALRGKQLKDLIHHGPSGKAVASRASVTAVLRESIPDEGEGDGAAAAAAPAGGKPPRELKFTRIITGRGCDYKIDGRTVALEKYTEALNELGLNIKARNFLVFQGDVESIAQKSQAEITQLFEIISGSGELKEEYERLAEEKAKMDDQFAFSQRKKKGFNAEKRQFKEQKEEAEKFKELQAQVNNIRAQHVLWQCHYLEKDSAVTQEQLDELNETAVRQTSRRQAIEEQLKSQRKEMAAEQKNLATAKRALGKQEAVLDRLRPSLLSAQEKIQRHNKNITVASKELERARKTHEKNQTLVKELEAELAQVQRASERFESSNNSEKITLNDERMKEYLKLKEQTTRETSKLQQKLDSIMRGQSTDVRARDRTTEKIASHRQRAEELDEDVRKQQSRLERLVEKDKEWKGDLERAEADRAQLAAEWAADEEEKRKADERLLAVKAQLRDAGADRNESRRRKAMDDAIDSMKRLFKGVRGRLVDLCHPSHERYNIAVTVIMGKFMDAVVVDNEAMALECIQYLRDQRVGTATFLPLDKLKTKDVKESHRTLGPNINLMLDVLEFDDTIKRAVLYAVGNTVVCKHEADAKRLCYGSDHNVSKAVTLDGTVVKSSGPISGGKADQEQRAHRWEEKKVDGLKREREELERKLEELRRAGRKRQKLEDFDAKIAGLTQRLQYAEADRKMMEGKIATLQGELGTVRSELERLEEALDKLEGTVAKDAPAVQKLKSELDQITDTVFADFCKSIGVSNIREYEADGLNAARAREEKRKSFTINITNLNSRLSYEKSRKTHEEVERHEQAIAEGRDKLEALQKEAEALGLEIAQEERKLRELEDAVREAQSAVDDAEIGVKELKVMLADHEKEMRKTQKSQMAKETLLTQYRNRRRELLFTCNMENIAIPILAGSLDDLQMGSAVATAGAAEEDGAAAAAMDEGGDGDASAQAKADGRAIELDYSELSDELKDMENAEDIRDVNDQYVTKIAQLTAEIESMAPNMRAVERLDGVQQRLEDVTQEVNKMSKARHEAAAAFDRVRTERKKRFETCFKHVQSVLDDIYKKLTASPGHAGGTAYLSLENAEEPYLAGITYNAMPPLKRFRRMEELSGGEKTVAALALLFAIHSHRPAPFFVLDEVDAALDNTNIGKVARYIDQRTNSSFQVVVISLKDQFYEKAESLVGIYRHPEQGCSKVLTADLSAYEEDPVK